MSDYPLFYRSIEDLGLLIRSGVISPLDLVTSHLERIDKLDSTVNAFITVLRKDALKHSKVAASEILSGENKGPLHGIAVGLKDIIDVEGIPTTAGSRILKENVASSDSTIVERLKNGGATILGKLNLSEFAIGGTIDHPFGTPRNPWGLDCSPGGSSSGSAVATAAGLCTVSLGSDTGGSIRGPAAFCGLVGLRPTYGRVTRHGVIPMCWSMDTVGPMARSVRDCAITLQVIAGYDSSDSTSSREPVPDYLATIENEVDGLRIAVIDEMFDADVLDIATKAAVELAIATLVECGCKVQRLSAPSTLYSGGAFIVIADVEAATFHSKWLHARHDEYDKNTRVRLETASQMPTSAYIKACRVMSLIRKELTDILKQCDVIAFPTTAGPAPVLDVSTGAKGGYYEGLHDLNRRRYLSPAALAGLPALSVPCGFSDDGMPVGLQLVGKPFDEGTLFRVGNAYESSTGWHMPDIKV